MNPKKRALKSAWCGIVSILVAGCGAGAGGAGVEAEGEVGHAAQAVVSEEPVCITVQRGNGAAGVADATIWEDAPDWNNGDHPTLGTGTSTAGGVRRSLLRFDLSAVPEGASVVSAVMTIGQMYKASDSTVRVHRVTSAWEESTVTWQSFGEGFDAAETTSFVAGAGVGGQPVDLTLLAQAWVSGAAENHGVLLEEDPVVSTEYGSSEKEDAEKRPKIELCYVESNACAGVLGLPGPPALPVGSNPITNVAVGDLDGDGKLDIAVADFMSHTVAVMFGQGNGTFSEPTNHLAVGAYPVDVKAADLNGDGRLDLAVLTSTTMSVFLNQGNGAFTSAGSYAAGSNAMSLAAADMNGDGSIELVVANNNRNLGVFFNQGNGAFAPRVNHSLNTAPIMVVAADMSGDGRPDLAMLTSDSVFVLRNLGNGTFATGTTYSAGSGASSIAAEDLDGDGARDLVIANNNHYSSTVSVLRNLGNSTFAPRVSYPTGPKTASAAAADLNGDGRADIAAVSQEDNSVSVLLNQGNGTFAPRVDYAAGLMPVGVKMEDLNGDGVRDLAVLNMAGDNIGVLLNQSDGTFAAASRYYVSNNSSGIAVGDLDGDGDNDIAQTVTGSGSGPASHLVRVQRNLGNGTFAYGGSYSVGALASAVVTADLNGDGALDLAVRTVFHVSVLLNVGNGSFAPSVNYPASTPLWSLTAADLNGDGAVELVVGNGATVNVLRNLGNGSFAPAVSYSAGLPGSSIISSITAADLSGDGRPDLALAYNSGLGNNTRVGVLLNNGNGTFAPMLTYTAGLEPISIAAADLNGDGAIDLAAGNKDGNSVSVLLNLGTGTFAPPIHYAAGSNVRSITAADMDGDDEPDLIVGNHDHGTVSVLLNLGDGTFAPRLQYVAASKPISITAADLNGDDMLDLAVICKGVDYLPSRLNLLFSGCLL